MQAPMGFRWLLTLALVLLIVILSVTPGQPRSGDSGFVWLVAMTPQPLQKLMHVCLYALLAGLWSWTLEGIEARWLRLALAFVLSVGLGGVLEWQQTRIPGRFGTLTDVLLNATGAAGGLLAAFLLL